MKVVLPFKGAIILACLSFVGPTSCFQSTAPQQQRRSLALAAERLTSGASLSRREAVTAAVLSFGALLLPNENKASAAQQDIEWTPFNGLIYNYRGGQFAGLDASTLDEPSVSFQEFGKRLEAGEVAFVEFLAPDGDKAYVTFKPSKEGDDGSQPIRIGEGYPIEQHDGWSSPSFVVRAVKNYDVPYKFVVPGLGNNFSGK